MSLGARMDLVRAQLRAVRRLELVQSSPGAVEVLSPAAAALVFNGMDVDATPLHAMVDAATVNLLSYTAAAGPFAVVRGAYVEGLLFGYEIRDRQL